MTQEAFNTLLLDIQKSISNKNNFHSVQTMMGEYSKKLETEIVLSNIYLNMLSVKLNEVQNIEPGGGEIIIPVSFPPTVTLSEVSDLTSTTCILNAIVNFNGALGSVQFEWGESEGLDQYKVVTEGLNSNNTPLNLNVSVTGLKSNTKYYFNVKATNYKGTVYGILNNFTTLPGVPNIKTYATGDNFYNKDYITFHFNSIIASNGGSDITSYGIVSAEHTLPVIASDKVFEIGSSNFVGTIEEVDTIYSSFTTTLEKFKTYYLRHYATNSAGTAYGVERVLVTGGSLLNTEVTLYTTENLVSYELSGLITKFSWASKEYDGGDFDTPPVYPNDDINNVSQYGCLYDWTTSNLIPPSGWELINDRNLGHFLMDLHQCKTIGTTYWDPPNITTYPPNPGYLYLKGSGYADLIEGELIYSYFRKYCALSFTEEYLSVIFNTDSIFYDLNSGGTKRGCVRLIKSV